MARPCLGHGLARPWLGIARLWLKYASAVTREWVGHDLAMNWPRFGKMLGHRLPIPWMMNESHAGEVVPQTLTAAAWC